MGESTKLKLVMLQLHDESLDVVIVNLANTDAGVYLSTWKVCVQSEFLKETTINVR